MLIVFGKNKKSSIKSDTRIIDMCKNSLTNNSGGNARSNRTSIISINNNINIINQSYD